MPRHMHKPVKTKSGKLAVQDMQETQKATMEIKRDLTEHNKALKIHAEEARIEDEDASPEDNSSSYSGNSLGAAASGQQEERESFRDAQKAPEAKSSSADAVSARKFSADETGSEMKKLAELQLSLVRMASDNWLSLFRIGAVPPADSE